MIYDNNVVSIWRSYTFDILLFIIIIIRTKNKISKTLGTDNLFPFQLILIISIFNFQLHCSLSVLLLEIRKCFSVYFVL